jgi:type I restriction enzyme S subunit
VGEGGYETAETTLTQIGQRRRVPASEYCLSVRDGTHDSPKPVEHGRKLVTSKHLKNGNLDLTEAYLISEEAFAEINVRSKVDGSVYALG